MREGLTEGFADGVCTVAAMGRNRRPRPWTMTPSTGRYGSEYLGRARTAYLGLGALATSEAIYAAAHHDAGLQPLDGSQRYVLRFNAADMPPADAFWSVTLYDADRSTATRSAATPSATARRACCARPTAACRSTWAMPGRHRAPPTGCPRRTGASTSSCACTTRRQARTNGLFRLCSPWPHETRHGPDRTGRGGRHPHLPAVRDAPHARGHLAPAQCGRRGRARTAALVQPVRACAPVAARRHQPRGHAQQRHALHQRLAGPGRRAAGDRRARHGGPLLRAGPAGLLHQPLRPPGPAPDGHGCALLPGHTAGLAGALPPPFDAPGAHCRAHALAVGDRPHPGRWRARPARRARAAGRLCGAPAGRLAGGHALAGPCLRPGLRSPGPAKCRALCSPGECRLARQPAAGRACRTGRALCGRGPGRRAGRTRCATASRTAARPGQRAAPAARSQHGPAPGLGLGTPRPGRRQFWRRLPGPRRNCAQVHRHAGKPRGHLPAGLA